MATIATIGIACAFGLVVTSPAFAGVRTVTTIPPETVKTTTDFDPVTHSLTITCDAASRGLCRFTVVDGARTTHLALRPKSRSVVAGVSGKARVCAVGRNPGVACNLVPVAT